MHLLQLSEQRVARNLYGQMHLCPHVSENMGKRPFITLITSRKNG
jgi:hypothetical protein